MKTVVHVITRLDKGGSAENVVLTCRSLDPAAYRSLLVHGPSEPGAAPEGISLTLIPELVRNVSPLADLRAFLRLAGTLRALHPDIVHTHSSKAGLIGRWAAKCAGVKRIVHTPHGHVFYGYGFSPFKTKLFILLERLTARITTKLLALTEGERRESLERGVGAPSQWRIVHSGVEPLPAHAAARASVRKRLAVAEGTLLVGTVARLEPVKGVRYLIEAAALTDRAKTGFLIVGDGGERPALERRVRELGLAENVIFTGMRNDVPDLLAAMDVFVQPSLNEGMGKTIIQAQAAGVPVIASRVQGIPDALREKVTGLLVPPADPAALAGAVSLLARDPDLRARLGAAGKAWVAEIVDGYPRFSSERMVHLLERTYEELLSS